MPKFLQWNSLKRKKICKSHWTWAEFTFPPPPEVKQKFKLFFQNFLFYVSNTEETTPWTAESTNFHLHLWHSGKKHPWPAPPLVLCICCTWTLSVLTQSILPQLNKLNCCLLLLSKTQKYLLRKKKCNCKQKKYDNHFQTVATNNSFQHLGWLFLTLNPSRRWLVHVGTLSHTGKPCTTTPSESMGRSFDCPSGTCHWSRLRPGPQIIWTSSCSAWAAPPILLNNSKLGGLGTKTGKATALTFLTPTRVQVVVRLTATSANSQVRASSIHSPAIGPAAA